MAQPEQKSRDARTASLLLSFVAGYVDSSTFLALFGFFVAQLTGSFVTVGAQIAQREQGILLTIFAIPTFVIAGVATTLLVALVGDRRRSPLAWSLALEGALLMAFLIVGTVGEPFVYPNAPLAVAAGLFGLSAMGVQSAAVQLIMRGMPSTNVMPRTQPRLQSWPRRRFSPGMREGLRETIGLLRGSPRQASVSTPCCGSPPAFSPARSPALSSIPVWRCGLWYCRSR
jgi:hypothetical protein